MFLFEDNVILSLSTELLERMSLCTYIHICLLMIPDHTDSPIDYVIKDS